MNREQVKEIIARYQNGTASTEERQWLENWYVQQELKSELSESDMNFLHVKEEIWQGVAKTLPNKKQPVKLWLKIAVASVVLLVLAAIIYLRIGREKVLINNVNLVQQVLPGRNRAILTLSDGRKIDLDNATKGQLAAQAGMDITKSEDGQIVYTIRSNQHEVSSAVNTIETPKGGQYQVVLPDGTKVWLNAASSLTYPISFAGDKVRRVELVGEAYFEVASVYTSLRGTKQSPANRLPFIVHTATQQVEVLGTHFNINSYEDEGKTVTTLAEGSVRVSSSAKNVAMLKPNEQAILTNNKIKLVPADMETALAWKNGWFEFKDADIQTILRQVSRWYNLDVTYQGNIPEALFTGHISRKAKLDAIVAMFNASNVNFKIEQGANRKILVVQP